MIEQNAQQADRPSQPHEHLNGASDVDVSAVAAEEQRSNGDAAPASTSSAKGKTKAISLGIGDEPGPRPWAVEDYVPEGHVTIMAGKGGTGKSMVATYLAILFCLRQSFFGKAVTGGPVLWLDAEDLGKDEVQRRAFQVARGLGLERPPEDLYYYRPDRPAGHDQTVKEVEEIVRVEGIRLIILDSLTIGAGGADMSKQGDVVQLLKRVIRWGATVLALDHLTKAGEDSGEDKASIFGSVHKRNMARSTFRLYEQKGALILAQDKSNFGLRQDPIAYEMEFAEDEEGRMVAVFKHGGLEHFAFSDGPIVMKAADYTLRALRELFEVSGEPVKLADLAAARNVVEKTIRNDLATLKERGDVIQQGPGLYTPNNEIVID